jgi:hypothetical protein
MERSLRRLAAPNVYVCLSLQLHATHFLLKSCKHVLSCSYVLPSAKSLHYRIEFWPNPLSKFSATTQCNTCHFLDVAVDYNMVKLLEGARNTVAGVYWKEASSLSVTFDPIFLSVLQ